MQQLSSNLGNPNIWSKSLFAHIREEGVDLTCIEHDKRNEMEDDNIIIITDKEIKLEIDY